jgi:nucleotide-binding universal stress UspA family protein
MTIRTIFVGASGGTASGGAVELACQLAARFGAHLEGHHVRFDPNEIIIAAAGGGLGMPLDGGWIEQMAQDGDSLAARTKAEFAKTAEQHGLVPADRPGSGGATFAWRDEIGRAAGLVPARARFFDLVVLGRSDRVVDQPSTDVIERTLLDSGRPVLLAPAAPPKVLGDIIAIGWDGSPRSVRAVAAAVPLLAKAKQVFVFTIGEKPEANADAIGDYLRWQGVTAIVRAVDAVEGVASGEQLLSAARDEGADMLLMGAYGHAPWREALFGGATRTIVGTSLLPVLLSH